MLAGEQARDITKMLDTAITSGRTLIQKGLVLTDNPNAPSVVQKDVLVSQEISTKDHTQNHSQIGLKSNEDDIIVTFETHPAGAEEW